MFGSDERGQAIQVGAILFFAFFVIGFASYQAVIVPQQNEQVEFDHSQEVQSDMVDLRDGIVKAANADESGVTDISLGTSYPARLFALNANPASGRFATTEQKEIVVKERDGTVEERNVCPDSAGQTADETVRATYDPSYSYYRNGPTTVYENTFVYSDTGDAQIVREEARLLFGESNGNDADNVLNLVAVFGDVEQSSSGSTSVDTFAGEDTVSPDVTDPVVKLPTGASESTWAAALGYEDPDKLEEEEAVESISVDNNDGIVTIKLIGNFDIACNEVGLNQGPPGGVANIAPIPAGGGSSPGTEVVYVPNGDSTELRSIGYKESTPSVYSTDTSLDVNGIGAKAANVDSSDSDAEIPYVNGNDNLAITGQDGGERLLVTGGSAQPTRLATGNVDGDGDVDVLFIGSNNDRVKRIDVSDSSASTITYGNSNQVLNAQNIIGFSDFNGDGDNDVIYVETSNNKIAYFDDDSVTKLTPGLPEPAAVGRPADFDGDDDLDVPYRDGDNKVEFIDSQENTDSVSSSNKIGTGSLATTVDEVGTDSPDIVFVDADNNRLRIIDPEDGTEEQYDGNDEEASSSPGAA